MDANPVPTISAPEKCASLIVFADGELTDSQIWHNVRSLGVERWRTQVLIVDRQAVDRFTSSVRITYRPIPQVFPELSTAIDAAKHPTVIIADPKVLIEPSDWHWMSNRICDSTIQTYLQKNNPVSGYKRILMILFRWILAWLLKTNKSQFNPGIVVSNKQLALTASNLQNSVHENDAPARKPASYSAEATRLLAFARVKRIPIEVVEFRQSVNNWLSPSTSSKKLLQSIGEVLRIWWNEIMFPVAAQKDPGLNSKPEMRWQIASWVMLLLGTMTILFSNLGYPLFEPDEARNAQLAVNIVESGDWLSLQLNGEPYWDKPPLQIWGIAACYKLFGISQWTTRLPGATATALTILLTLLLGQRMVGFRSALFGAALLLLSSGFVLLGRYVTMDAGLTFFLSLMSLSLFVAAENARPQFWLALAGIAAGCGLLIKGPVIIVLGFPPVLAALWLAGNNSMLKPKRWLLFLVPAFLIASPWYLATTLVHPDFLVYFFWKHHVVRFSDAFNHREPFWYYLPTIFILMFPASYLLPSLVKFITSRNESNRWLRTSSHGFLVLTAGWIIGFFSISEAKLPTYIVPALPSICLLMGVLLDKKIFASAESGWQSLSTAVSGPISFLQRVPHKAPIVLLYLTVTILLAMAIFFKAGFAQWLLVVVCTSALAVVAVIAKRASTRPLIAWCCAGVMAFSFVFIGVNQLAPQIARWRSIHVGAKYLRSQPDMLNAPVVFFGRENYGVGMTLPTDKVIFFESEEADSVCKFLHEHPRSIIVSSKPEMKNLRRMLDWTIVLEKSDSQRHLYLSRPNPELIADKNADRAIR